ncbi:MAG: type II secretion system protein [Bacilli bacterium]|nr:type II secretion system protein [Bacilli bacterium]
MKKNGFTFIEVLAMITVIGIIMVVAIPNITGMMNNQKLDLIKSDAVSMVEAAKMKANKDRAFVKPKKGDCVVFSLNYLDDNDNIVKGPNGGEYNKFDSVVVYTRKGNKYKYYVRLVEEYKGKRTGIHLVDGDEIQYLKTRDIKKIEDNIGITKNDRNTEGLAKLRVFGSITAECDYIRDYYSGGNYCTKFNDIYYDNEGNVVSKEEYLSVCS